LVHSGQQWTSVAAVSPVASSTIAKASHCVFVSAHLSSEFLASIQSIHLSNEVLVYEHIIGIAFEEKMSPFVGQDR